MVDLRSDTISMPTREMLETILCAELGDDGRTDEKGRGEDLAVNRLEDLAAEITGKEAAVLFPSGTQGNTAAVMAWCRPKDKVMVDVMQHIYISEKVLFDPEIGQMEPVTYQLDAADLPDLTDMERILKEEKIKLVCVENTHNFTGGTCVPVERMKEIYNLAHSYGVPVHMDGARLFNAAVGLNVTAKEICRYTDSLMFCISKGLGAPVGSLVCGTEEMMLKVRAKRKLLGGSMRQAGVIAAPGIYALEHNIRRLSEDHENAAFTAKQLRDLKHTKIVGTVDSNIIVLDVNDLGLTPSEYCKKAEEKGLLIKPVLSDKVRLVFYMDIDREKAKEAVEIIRGLDAMKD